MLLLRTCESPTQDLNLLLGDTSLLDVSEGPKLEPGFPLLFSDNGNLHWGAFAFLVDIQRLDSARSRKRTIGTYAEGLKSWLEFVEERDADWTRPTALLLSEFRRLLSRARQGRDKVPRKRSSSTVNLRTATVREFYKFLEFWDGAGLADSGGEWEVEPIRQFLLRTARIKRAKKYKKKPRAMSPEEVALMAATIKMPYNLVFRWTICTGLRISTATSLLRSQLPRRVLKVNYIEVEVKGEKRAEVIASGRLISSTMDYCETLRNKHAVRGKVPSDRIFINSRGTPVNSKAYYQAFKRAAEKVGLKLHPHMTRHTFATSMEARLNRMVGEGHAINPLKVVQHLLAHNNAKTTEEYLASVSSSDAGIVRALLEMEEALI
jgi:integrase